MFWSPHILCTAREHIQVFSKIVPLLSVVQGRDMVCSDMGLPQTIPLSIVCNRRLSCVWGKLCRGLKEIKDSSM